MSVALKENEVVFIYETMRPEKLTNLVRSAEKYLQQN